MARPAIQITGLRELRRDLRKIDKQLPKQLTRELRAAVAPAAAVAAAHAPRSDRKRSRWAYKRHLADTIRPYAQARSVGLRSPAPHARIVHNGGRRPADTANREKWITVPPRPFMDDAIKARTGQIIDAIGDAVERTVTRNGWH